MRGNMKRTPLAPLDHSHKSLGCVVGLGCIIWLAFYGGVLALIACGILFLLGVLPL